MAKGVNAEEYNGGIISRQLKSVYSLLTKAQSEHASLKKMGNSALSYNVIAKMALTIIGRETESKNSKPKKR